MVIGKGKYLTIFWFPVCGDYALCLFNVYVTYTKGKGFRFGTLAK